MSTVIVPRHAGVLSALGLLLADVVRDASLTVRRPGDAVSLDELEASFAPLVAELRDALARDGVPAGRVQIVRLLDVRYAGQSYEIPVPYADGFRAAFDERHGTMYGYANPRRAIEIVTLRAVAVGVTDKPALPAVDEPPGTAVPLRVGTARFDGRAVATGFFRWDDLAPGAAGEGPAVVAGGEATVVVPPGFRFRVDGSRNLVATRGR
jgi:N-methylhydantoinase A/oxoprolinase/acetone carboxylase beta subunit